MRQLLRSLAATCVLVAVWMIVPSVGAAGAASIDDLGWWTRANQHATIGGALVFPDVTPGQLLVEGTPEGATAIAALRATLPEGMGNPVLTLRSASAVGAERAVLLACQSGSGWTGAHAGSWDAKPSPDCSQSVQGVPSEDGTEWTFAVGALQFGDQLDVVLTPGLDPDSSDSLGSTFRVVFERPAPDAVEVSPALPSSPAVPTFDMSPPESGSSSGAPVGAAPSSSGVPSFSVPSPPTLTELASQPAQAALPPEEQGRTATAPALNAPRQLATGPIQAPAPADGKFLGLLVALAAAGLLYWSSQLPVPDRHVLSRFATSATGSTATVPATPEPTVGGLGRFRRERATPARRLG